MYQRNAAPRLAAALADTPVVLIHGARQAGKSTLARGASDSDGGPTRRYLTLDDATVLAAARADPMGFVAGLRGSVTIDEVQRAPELFPAIKASVDRDRTPGRFLLTGSANVLLLPRLAESLAGRLEIITLWPLSQGELGGVREGFIDAVFAETLPTLPEPNPPRVSLAERVAAGGYPEPVSRPLAERRAAWFGAYLTTILQRDVRDISAVEGLADLPRLLSLMASRAGGLVNFADLARSLSMPQSTLKRYVTLLEATFLVNHLPAWSSNLGLRLSKAPKLLIADTGLACFLLGLDAERLSTDGIARGPMVENFVAMELIKAAAWSRLPAGLFHYRTQTGREVDLVLEDPRGRLVGVEIKSGATVDQGDFSGLRAMADAVGDRFARGVVLHDGDASVWFGDRLVALPLGAIWSLGATPTAPAHEPAPTG